MTYEEQALPIRNSATHRILAALAAHDGLTAHQIKSVAELTMKITVLKGTKMLDLVRKGWVISVGMDIYRLSTAGLDIKMQLGDARLSKGVTRTAAVKRAEVFQRESYQPLELGRTCHRPGAYDAFELPSMMLGKRVYRTDAAAATQTGGTQ
jgi:hypothetical protein